MHLTDNLLRAYLDRELTDQQVALIQDHLSTCSGCARKFDMIHAIQQQVTNHIQPLAPQLHEMPEGPKNTYRRLLKLRKEPKPMIKRYPIWTALAVIAVVIVLFSFTPVQTWASSFLGLFRVEKITVIPFNPAAIEDSHQGLASHKEAMKEVFGKNLDITGDEEVQEVASSTEAAAQAGFTPRLPDLPDQSATFYVKTGMQASLIIDQPRMQAILDAAEMNIEIPASVNGQEVKIEVPNAILTAFGECPEQDPTSGELKDCTVLIQLPSPTVKLPDELNVPQLGEAVLQFLGLSAEEARSLSATIDWTSTLILPIPQGEEITYEEVLVDGGTGTLLQSEENDVYTLVWVKNGMLYMLAGSGGKEAARPFVNLLP